MKKNELMSHPEFIFRQESRHSGSGFHHENKRNPEKDPVWSGIRHIYGIGPGEGTMPPARAHLHIHIIIQYHMSQHHTSGRQGQGPRRRNNRQGKYSQGGEYRGSKGKYRNSNNSTPRKEKLTFWQKLLKMVGLYKAPFPKKENLTAGKNAKTNTRIARPRSESRAPVSKQPVSSPRLYVGNLSYEATESDLEDLFKGIGTVRSVEIIYNPRTHKSKGYAFVEMQFMDDAKRSVEVLHDQPFMGRLMTVSAANERQDTPRECDSDTPRNEDRDEITVQAGIEEKVYSLGGNA